jgi:putative flippase GtrA
MKLREPGIAADATGSPISARAPEVEIVVPVRNEERDLAPSIRRLHAYLTDRFPFTACITIADNGSTDGTWVEALTLEGELSLVRAVHLDQPGRGRALRAIWSASDADVLAYMDVDLSTDLNALLPLVAPLLSGHSDVAIGTRLAPGARVIRGPRREIISRCYNLLLHATLQVGFSDAQCGFKAIRADKARVLLPLTEDNAWFFDTELLVLAERAGLRIHEIPVDWIDDTDSRVDVVATALADLRGIVRLGGGLLRGSIQVPMLGDPAGPPGREGSSYRLRPRPDLRLQLLRFVAVGTVSTIAYVLLYLALRGVMGALGANALSLLATTAFNTALNRRFTFGVRGRQYAARDQARGLLAFAVALVLTSAALVVLTAASPAPSVGAEVTALVIANLLAAVLRFALYRRWVFRGRRPPEPEATTAYPDAQPQAAASPPPPGVASAVPASQATAPLVGTVLPRAGAARISPPGGGGR